MKPISNLKKTVFLLLKDKITLAGPLANLDEQVILVTGGSKGLGLEIVKELLRCGSKVAVMVRNTQGMEILVQEYGSTKLLVLSGDVQNYDDCKNAVSETTRKFGQLNALINNAGMFLENPLEKTSKDTLDKMVDTNLKGVIQMSIFATEQIKKQNFGTIINIGSKISHNTQVGPNKTLYAATKYGVEGFSFALNRELKAYGGRCVCLMPGTINTFVSVQSGKYLAPQRVAQFVGQILKFHDIDFEGIVFKSINQEI